MRNLKLAARMLRKTPFVTVVAVLSLSLGIGANSAIFSLFEQLLMSPLPVPAPRELVNLAAPGPKTGSTSCNQAGDCSVVFSYPMFRDLERDQRVLASLAAHRAFGASLSVDDSPVVAEGVMVSGAYFPTLQVQPALGRLLTPADDGAPGANFVTVLSYAFWLDRFGGDPQVLDRSIVINGRSYDIVGVAPEGFHGATLGSRPAVYVPISMRGQVMGGPTGFENRRNYWVYVFGRLAPGGTIEEATESLTPLYRSIINDVEVPLQQGMSDQQLEQFRVKPILVEAGAKGQSSIHDDEEVRVPLYLMFSVTGVVLLIACANIANLLLARGASRAGEMGIRLALGARRGQLLNLLLTESVLLALLGGVASLLVARWTLAFIGSMLPTEDVPILNFELQPAIVVFAAGLSIATGLLFGTFPALHSTRSDLITSIRAGATHLAGGKAAARFRAGLVTVQIALSMALLVSAGLFLKSLVNLSRVDLGLDVDNVVTFSVAPTRAGYDTLRAHLLFDQIEEELATIPGVTGVTSSLVPLLGGDNWGNSVRVQGFDHTPDTDNSSNFNAIGADYFHLLGVPLIAGRDIQLSDLAGGSRVAVVNQEFADKFELGSDAVGKFMSQSGPGGGDSLNIQIVGLITNAAYSEVRDSIPAIYYIPWRQMTNTGNMNFYVQAALPPEDLLRTVSERVAQLAPTVPVERLKTMPQQIRENVFLDRLMSTLSTAFAVLATLLAAIGLYGVLAYTVAQRTREIGVRMALGADGRRVRGLVLRQVAILTAIGGTIGVAAALGLGRAARSLLFELEGHDPIVFALAVVMLALIALAAGYVPARRAAAVDPMRALRYD